MMQPTDDTMTQIVRMVQAGWSVDFHPATEHTKSGIVAQKPGVMWVDTRSWQDDIPAAWAKLVEAWERQVGDE